MNQDASSLVPLPENLVCVPILTTTLYIMETETGYRYELVNAGVTIRTDLLGNMNTIWISRDPTSAPHRRFHLDLTAI